LVLEALVLEALVLEALVLEALVLEALVNAQIEEQARPMTMWSSQRTPDRGGLDRYPRAVLTDFVKTDKY
jgi:hypothetical protein